MSMVQYYPGESFVHKLDPRAKFISLILLTVMIFAVTDFRVISMILSLAIMLWLVAKLPISVLTGYVKFIGALLLILLIFQAFFYPGKTILFQLGILKIREEGIVFGLILGLRLVTLICLMPLVTFTTKIEKLSLGLIKLGLPYTIAYTVTTALIMIPILQSELKTIMDAQRLRGFEVFEKGKFTEKIKAYPTLVVPLIISSMREAKLMGVAMDSRAFGASKSRTFLEDIVMQPKDWLYMIFIVLFVTAGFLVNYNYFI